MESYLTTNTVVQMLTILKREYIKWNAPIVTFVARTKGEHPTPFRVLVATILSLRTKDETTTTAVNRLFEKAQTPQQMLTLSSSEIEKLIYPVGFYRVKAVRLREISQMLIDQFGGQVPDTIEELLRLPGVGRKTANLVVSLGYGKPAICVDVHVHRISNRWNYVHSKTPEQTEFLLRDKLPLEWWIDYNDLLVAFGQTICKPVSPFCSTCPINQYCPRRGVERSR